MVEVRTKLVAYRSWKKEAISPTSSPITKSNSGVSFRKIASFFAEGIVALFVPSSFALLPFASVRRRKRTIDLHSTLVYFRSEEIS